MLAFLPLLSGLLLSAPLLLSACAAAGTGRPPTLRQDAPRHEVFRQDGHVVPPDLFVPEDDGARLPARFWAPPPGTPSRAVVVALHGFGDSRDAWERVGPWFAAHGVALLAYDQRGFGAAPGRGHWAGTGRLLDDAVGAARLAARLRPGAPLFLMGESMGGAELMVLIAGDRLARAHVAVAGTILLAPAVWGRGQMAFGEVASLAVADAVAPDWVLTGREIALHISASDDRAALIRLARDPLSLTASRVSLLAGLVDLMTAAQRAAPDLTGPVLIATGAHDELVPPEATAAAWAKLPAGVRRAWYANGWHLMMRDLDRGAVERDVLSWILHPDWPLPSGADVLAAAWMAARPWEDAAPDPLPASLTGGAFEPARDRGPP